MAGHPFDEGEIVLHRREFNGRVHVTWDCPPADLVKLVQSVRATRQIMTGIAVEAGDKRTHDDAAEAALAYEQCMTELACWSLVFQGELMLEVVPFDQDQLPPHAGLRRVRFRTIDRMPVVLGGHEAH